MKPMWMTGVCLSLSLLACDATPPAVPAEGGSGAAAPARDALPHDQPAEDVPPATAADLLPPPPADAGVVRTDGYGPLRIGMSREEVDAAWGGPALDDAGIPDGTACYYLFPGGADAAEVAFMLESGRFVRYDARDPGLEAPGGGRVGDSGDAIRALHAGRIESSPHKYVEGGQYLRVTSVSGGSGVLVFELDADGRVSGWHAGQAPQVDYVEGCS